MSTRMIQALLLALLLTGCRTLSDSIAKDGGPAGQRIFRACESLRCGDPEIARQGIAELFSVGGLEAYTILHLKWISEPNPEIRRYILKGFLGAGDDRHIADPTFPQEWVDAVQRCSSPEKEIRLRELREYFPREMARRNR